MKYTIIIIFSVLNFWGCQQEQHSNKYTTDEYNKQQSKTAISDLSVSDKIKVSSDTIVVKENAFKKWTFNKETVFIFPSEKSDDYYNYAYLKIGNTESGKFIRIPKENSPFTGFEKMVVKPPYFTIEQSYREDDYTNYEYITFKKEAHFIYLYKYAVDYTNNQKLEEDIPSLRLDQKIIGKIEMENVTNDFLASLRSKK